MKKKIAIIIIAVIVFLTIIGVVVISLVNNNTEKQLTTILDEKIKENFLTNNFKYDDIHIIANKGLIIINGIEFKDDDIVLNLDSVKIQLQLNEVVKLSQNPMDTTLTEIVIDISGVKLMGQDITLEQDNLVTHLKGHINTKIFDSDYSKEISDTDLGLKEISIKLGGFKLLLSSGVMNLQDFNFDINGEFNPSIFDKNYKEYGYIYLVKFLDKISFNLNNLKFEAEQELRNTISMLAYMYLGDVSFIGNQENWEVEKLALETVVINNKISINNIDLITKWINLNVKASINIEETFEDFTPLDVKITMKDYIDELRPIFESIIDEMTGEELPKDNFSLNILLANMNSNPEVNLEQLTD